jgi:amino-acid N-acetyltransferase
MSFSASVKSAPKFEDLRGILHYVPQFRQKIFVLAIDGQLLRESSSMQHLLEDVAILQSLNIEVVLVFGARAQINDLAKQQGVVLSSDDGMGVTDDVTSELSIQAILRQSSELMASLTALDIAVINPNALVVNPMGFKDGVDMKNTGRIERVDTEMLRSLLKLDFLCLMPPMAYDGRGKTLRLNSDAVAIEIGIALQAAKIIFVAESGIFKDSQKKIAQITAEEARKLAKDFQHELDINLVSKLKHGAMACQEGVPRVHIIDGTHEDALLSELFSNEGVGTMIHADEYQQIRAAQSHDVVLLLGMMQQSVEETALVLRTREQILEKLEDFYVLEIDNHPVGCVAIHVWNEGSELALAEIACLFVKRSHKGKGHGKKLVQYAEGVAKKRGVKKFFALSTQAFQFFEEQMGYEIADSSVLPLDRLKKYESSGRNSKVLIKGA